MQLPLLSCFCDSDDGVVVHFILADQYTDWLKHQTDFVRSWIQTNEYTGRGFLILPAITGTLESVVYVKESLDDFFLAEELPNQLPKGRYKLDLTRLPEKDREEIAFRFSTSWGLSAYRFEKYKPADKEIAQLYIMANTRSRIQSFVEAIHLVRDLVNTPAGDLMPGHLAEYCQSMAERFNADIHVISGDALLEQNYPTIHAVGRASVHAPKLIDMTWGDEDAPKITLVGKGVCFDSGGLDLKPSQFMRLMKKDMGGAAHVLGLAYLIMANKLPVRLRVLIPAVENAVSSNAFRPGDVITTRQGITVEIDNTDAEGRLVLCDALTEANSESPDLIVDFATLTGACRVALGTELPGFFSNSTELAHQIYQSGNDSFDPVWQLPLHKPYQDMLKSEIADTLNSAASGHGGAITAALYLNLFVSPSTPWLHFDIMAWNNRKLPGRPIGGEAFGVRAVYHYLESNYGTGPG